MKYLNRDIDTIFVMLGENCNFSCKYCMQHPLGMPKIQPNVNKKVIEFIKEAAKNNSKELFVQFFGGEPLLYYRQMQEIVRSIKKSCQYGIITNGSLITNDMVKFFNKNSICVCVSWDGRNTKHTRGRDVFENKALKDTIFKIENLGISSVLSSYTYINDVLDDFTKLNDEYMSFHNQKRSLSFNADEISDVGNGIEHKELLEINYKEVSNQVEILLSEYEKFLKKEPCNMNKAMYIQSKVNSIIKSKDLGDTRSACCCQNGYSVVNVDLDGNLYQCHNNSVKIGHIEDNMFKVLMNTIQLDRTRLNNSRCSLCDAQPVCNNGCPLVPEKNRIETYCKLKRAMYIPIVEFLVNTYGMSINNT